MSLAGWDNIGILKREILLYTQLIGKGFQVSFITYGNSDDLKYSNRLSGIKVLCNKWGLPKGHMEEGDKVYSNCASRELFEETGVRYNINQIKFVFKRVNKTIYYPIILKERSNLKQLDKEEILKVEWKNVDELIKETPMTRYHNRDLKVFLHRYFYDVKKLAQRNHKAASQK